MAKTADKLLYQIVEEMDGIASTDDVAQQAVVIRPREKVDDKGLEFYRKALHETDGLHTFLIEGVEYVATEDYLTRAFREKDETEITRLIKVKPDLRFLYGVEQLPVTPETAYYVPTTFRGYIPQRDEFMVLSEMVTHNFNVLIEGPTGVGKTMLILDWCFLRRQGVVLVSVTDFDAKTFIGEFILDENRQMKWKDGPLPTAMRHGLLLYLDEINMAENQILAALNHALMYREYYVAETDEWVRAHPNFRCVAAMNPHEGHLGTKELNPAVKRRFRIHLLLENPTPENEKKIVKTQTGYEEDEFIDKVIQVATSLRHDAEEGVELISSPCSPDHLVTWTKLVMGGRDAWRAFELAVVGGAEPQDREHFREVMQRTFGPVQQSENWDELQAALISEDEFKRRLHDVKNA